MWNGEGYNIKGELDFEIKLGKGKIKEYNNKGELLFKGEYLNVERNGKEKEYNNNGELKFDSEYLMD